MESPTDSHGFLLQQLHLWAVEQPEKVAVSFFESLKKTQQQFSYKQLNAVSHAIAESLLSDSKLALKKGDCVMLVFVPGLEFIATFLGCLRAGLIAVPVYPPDPRNTNKTMHSFVTIQANCGAGVALTHDTYQTAKSAAGLASAAASFFKARSVQAQWPDMTWHSLSSTIATAAKANKPPPAPPSAPAADDVAFLQYTSGSTSEPKGVTITHGNLRHNLSVIVRSLQAETDTVVVSWLPQYHDMGLIGAYLGVLYCGGSGHYMSPLTFIKSPALWVQAMSHFKATHVQGPNFAYKLTARKWLAAGGAASGGQLDLSALRHIFNAAEPVTSSAMDAFVSAFAPHGLKPSAFHPGFGMAESSVYICDGGRARVRVDKAALETQGVARPLAWWAHRPDADVLAEAKNGSGAAGSVAVGSWSAADGVEGGVPTSGYLELVGCGPVDRNADIAIAIARVDEEEEGVQGGGDAAEQGEGKQSSPSDASSVALQEVPEGTVGELLVSSASIAAGYWGQPQATAHAFGARLCRLGADEADETQWMRSGDLCFVLGGELFVAGRAKDLIIVRGRNHFPQDIEGSVEAAAPTAVRPGCVAAFQIPQRVVSAATAALAAKGIAGAATGGGAPAATPPAQGSEDTLVVVAEVRTGTDGSTLAGVAASVAASVAREHGVSLGLLLLLQQHTAVKTTSGKIARKWNATALRSLGGADADTSTVLSAASAGAGSAAGAGTAKRQVNPWGGGSKAVLYWHEGASSGDDTEEGTPAAAGVVEEAGAVGSGGALAVGAGGGAGAHLTGHALAVALKGEISSMVGTPVEMLDEAKPLFALGLDSISLSQLGGSLSMQYGLNVSDEQVFAEGCSIVWMVNNAQALRAQQVHDPSTHIPAPAAGEGGTEIVQGGAPEPGVCQKYAPCCVCCY